jgi:hypothetical protein
MTTPNLNRYYSISFPRKHKLDLEIVPGGILLQNQADQKFITTLVHVSWTGSKCVSNANQFLDHQFESTPFKNEFLKHIENILAENEYQFKPNTEFIGHIADWIKAKRSIQRASTIEIVSKPRKKLEITDLLVKPTEFELIIQSLIKNNLIKDKLWVGEKMDFVAFIRILAEEKIVAPKPITTIGNIFAHHFQIELNQRNFRNEPKADTTSRISKAMGLK